MNEYYSKPNPGPWWTLKPKEINRHRACAGVKNGIPIFAIDAPAAIAYTSYTCVEPLLEDTPRDIEEKQMAREAANARLIAAAPTLMEALEKILQLRTSQAVRDIARRALESLQPRPE